jgi:hypothetical protein
VPPAAPASSATAPVAGAAGAATGIDDVLKEFLDLDLGD